MRIIDLAVNWGGEVREEFLDFLAAESRKRKLSFLAIMDWNVKDVVRRLKDGRLMIRVLLDTQATYNLAGDEYSRVCYAVKDTGGIVINDPDRTVNAINKSVMHFELINAGIDTPYTIVVRNWQPQIFRLTDKEKKKLGVPFIIKPASGYSQLGVLKEAKGSVREIALARNFDKGDSFLLQKKIKPIWLGGKRAWFRVYNVFDKIVPCLWDDHSNIYENVTCEFFKRYRLYPLVRITTRIAGISRMSWFSSEIAVDEITGRRRFVVIDYVNDQCDMSLKSRTSSGVPDNIVKFTSAHIVRSIARILKNRSAGTRYEIVLKDKRLMTRGLGNPPAVLRP
ncbi:MAG: hypothetical protein JXJ19_08790 [Elusimicrobia bacterium]|nr:hypothetical protein [Elusimicrobiota bacterium]